jgi:hypothetical protein
VDADVFTPSTSVRFPNYNFHVYTLPHGIKAAHFRAAFVYIRAIMDSGVPVWCRFPAGFRITVLPSANDRHRQARPDIVVLNSLKIKGTGGTGASVDPTARSSGHQTERRRSSWRSCGVICVRRDLRCNGRVAGNLGKVSQPLFRIGRDDRKRGGCYWETAGVVRCTPIDFQGDCFGTGKRS